METSLDEQQPPRTPEDIAYDTSFVTSSIDSDSVPLENSFHDHVACQFRADKEWLDRQFHDGDEPAIRKPDELESEMSDPPGEDSDGVLDRIQGSIIGMTLGDALGAHVEFRPRDFLVEHPVEDLQGGGTWGLAEGQFTDDTSMALCLANSLLARKDFVPYDQLVRYKWWYRNGYMSSTGSCFDIGAATRQSIEEFERRQRLFAKEHHLAEDRMDCLSDEKLLQQFDVNCSEDGVAGNGALMRLAPVPLFFYQRPKEAVLYSGISGRITHGDVKAYDACRYYGALIVAALAGETKEQLLAEDFYGRHRDWFNGEELHADVMSIARGSFKRNNGYDDGIRGKGYIINALEAALWAFWADAGSFHTGALAAVNLGDDTDTTAAIYGQLAGAYYGFRKLPSEWVEKVYARPFLTTLSKWIVYEGRRWALTQGPIVVTPAPVKQPLDESVSSLKSESSVHNMSIEEPSTSESTNSHQPHLPRLASVDPPTEEVQPSASESSQPNVTDFIDHELQSSSTSSHSSFVQPQLRVISFTHDPSANNNDTPAPVSQPGMSDSIKHEPPSPPTSVDSSFVKPQLRMASSDQRSSSENNDAPAFVEPQPRMTTITHYSSVENNGTPAFVSQHETQSVSATSSFSFVEAQPRMTSFIHQSSTENNDLPAHASFTPSEKPPSSLPRSEQRPQPSFGEPSFRFVPPRQAPPVPPPRADHQRVYPMTLPVHYEDKTRNPRPTASTFHHGSDFRPGHASSKPLYQGKNLAKWTISDVHHWIASLGMNFQSYADRFRDEKVDGFGLFSYVGPTILQRFGVSNEEHRQAILNGIQTLKSRLTNSY